MERQGPNSFSESGGQTPGSKLIEFLELITKHRKFISRFVLGVTVVVTIVALLLPKWYKSTASVFPAERTDLLGILDGVSSLAKAFSPAKALTSLTGNPELDRYMVILKSGTVLNAVIEKFDLVNVYEITAYPGEKTAKELLSNVEFSAETEGNLSITVYDKEPQRAADMANFFVEMLNKTNTELLVQNARGNRQFIEDRYNKNLHDLAAAEDSMKAFQRKYGIFALPEQTKASIEAMADITGKLALKEVEYGVLRRTLSPEHPSVMSTMIEIEETRKKLTQFNRGTNTADGEMKVIVPFAKIPELGGEYLRRYRDVEIQYKILQFIMPVFEQAKVEERRQTPSVVILDRAGPAERKAKPKVSLFGLIALVGSSLVALVVVIVLELLEKLSAKHPERFPAILSTLRKDWFGLKISRSKR